MRTNMPNNSMQKKKTKYHSLPADTAYISRAPSS